MSHMSTELVVLQRGDTWLFITGSERRGLPASVWLPALADRLGWPASSLRLEKAASGRPRLRLADAALFCSLSHAIGLTAVAFDQRDAVGIDAETISPSHTDADMLAEYFVPARLEQLRSIAAADNDGFLRRWTAAEAWLKAHGLGVERLVDVPSDVAAAGCLATWREMRCGRAWRISRFRCLATAACR